MKKITIMSSITGHVIPILLFLHKVETFFLKMRLNLEFYDFTAKLVYTSMLYNFFIFG